MIEMGTLCIQTIDCVERYVVAVMNMRRVERDKHSKVSTRSAAMEQLRRASVDLGLNTGSFAKVRPPAHKTDGKPDSVSDLVQ